MQSAPLQLLRKGRKKKQNHYFSFLENVSSLVILQIRALRCYAL